MSVAPEALEYMVDKAVEYKLGARGLRSIMEAVMMDLQYEAPSQEERTLTVTRDYVQQQLDKSFLSEAVRE